MVRNSHDIQFPVLYLIIPVMLGIASAVPAGDAVLQVTGVEPTDSATVVSRIIAGLFIGLTLLLVMVLLRRNGAK
jgi:hypothetical protein